jgi:hypothetical protein
MFRITMSNCLDSLAVLAMTGLIAALKDAVHDAKNTS